MTTLDDVTSLTHAGSLLSAQGRITASYDLEVSDAAIAEYRALSASDGIHNANTSTGTIRYDGASRAHIINGMGVTLGDSIVGLTALAAVQHRYPGISFSIYRPARTPLFVKTLYQLAAPLFGTVLDLPVPLDALPPNEPKVDVGNHLFWPNFSTMPMIDFFLWALGLEPADIALQEKSNGWLKQLGLPDLPREWKGRPYILLAPTASTPVRSIPSRYLPGIVSRLWAEFRLPIVGSLPIEHEHYINISTHSQSTASYLSWVRGSTLLVTSDTSALHVGAGFDVPTAAFFTTIPSTLRARDYPKCAAIDFPIPALTGIHASARPADLALVERAYSELDRIDWIGALRARTA
ncbi:ADP-heptose--LPS heptosyltransferase [Trinickia diaoshuihuensis]|uniref:ADP-heptose--LPS heptosyltransferase n=1 Tax=Trinickia diaoshuihuensis TaxID=2292265 RepID=UPI000E2242E0|nr:ADP-heptose--LPS heptosyltransferase [Trinickia diaoshuihuensis]